ncbi:unnamed protein product [Prorocentrum cordatum]|uniref:RNA exonuclease 4 n=1 Tax=Prorocentrum cordatum TaxID=2364126 RepID=A0ABN9XY31_9DINO|nr:unnamed protein product [Polarella glacialis]
MVGVGAGGTRSVLARVSVVDYEGAVLLDRFVLPQERITDYRSHITGITAATLRGKNVLSEAAARQKTAEVLEGKVVVGHSLQNDFQALMLSHPHEHIRDTALFRPLRPPGRENRTPSLAGLVEHWFREKIHSGQHDSVEDARMALRLYRLKSRAGGESRCGAPCGDTPPPSRSRVATEIGTRASAWSAPPRRRPRRGRPGAGAGRPAAMPPARPAAAWPPRPAWRGIRARRSGRGRQSRRRCSPPAAPRGEGGRRRGGRTRRSCRCRRGPSARAGGVASRRALPPGASCWRGLLLAGTGCASSVFFCV